MGDHATVSHAHRTAEETSGYPRDEVGQDIGDRERQRLAAYLVQVTAGIGHEINNPLTYVVTNLQLALRGIDRMTRRAESRPTNLDAVGAALREALEGTNQIRNIVRDLSSFSEADERRLGPVDIHEVLELSIKMSFHDIRHRARLVRDFSSTVPVEGDASRLARVFVNLLVNAAHAIPAGAIDVNTVWVRTAMLDDRVVVDVVDTGAGISPETLPKIFDPFFTTKPVGRDGGLGLSICREIIETHGGELHVESEVGTGTTFRVLLPVVRSSPRIEHAPNGRPATEPRYL